MRSALLLLCAAAVCSAQVYRVETVAGTGSAGYSGDDGSAFRSELNHPSAVALDTAGRIYIADTANNRVRRIDPDGIIRTIAEVDAPTDVAVDASGTVYIASGALIRTISSTLAELTSVAAVVAEPSGTVLAADGSRVVRVAADGTVTELAVLQAAISGLAEAPDGTIYAAAGDSIQVLKNGAAPAPLGVNVPVSPSTRLTVDRWGSLYVSGSNVWQIAGSTAFVLGDAAAGMAVDIAGNVYFADPAANQIRILRAPATGSLNALSPSNRAIEIWPRGVTLFWNALANATSYEVLFGTSPGSLTTLGTPTEAAFALEPLAEKTTYYWQVKTRFPPLPPIESPVFSFTTTGGSGGQPPPLPDSPSPVNPALGQPTSLMLTWHGGSAARYEVYLAEDSNTRQRVGVTNEPKLAVTGLRPETVYYWRVLAVNDIGQTMSPVWQFTTGPANGYPWLIETVAGTALPTADGTLATDAVLFAPRNPVADVTGNIFFINGERSVRRVAPDGKLTTVFTMPTDRIVGLAADQSNNIYIATSSSVFRLSRTGQRTFIAGQPNVSVISAVAADRRGNVYIADPASNRIQVVESGQVRTFAETQSPSQIAVDGSGNVYAYGNGLLQKFASDGTAQRIAPETEIGPLSGLTVDGSGNLYLLDTASTAIRRIDSSGNLTDWASGFSSPLGIAADNSGNILIGDTRNSRIQRLDFNAFATTVAGTDTSAYLLGPTDVAPEASGAVYIADSLNNRIRRAFPGRVLETVANANLPSGGVLNFNERGDLLFNNHQPSGTDAIVTLTPNGTIEGSFDSKVPRVGGIARGLSGELYFSDTAGHRIFRIDPDGTSKAIAGTGAPGFAGEGGPAVIAQLNTPRARPCPAANCTSPSSADCGGSGLTAESRP